MTELRLRRSARGIILDEQDRVLLCRFAVHPPGTGVWAAPGGGVEAGETLRQALRRELREEVGLILDTDPPHVWHRRLVALDWAPGYDGVTHDYFLIRAPAFEPRGEMSDAELAAENITELRWWTRAELAGYSGTDLFGPRDFPAQLAALLTERIPSAPIHLPG